MAQLLGSLCNGPRASSPEFESSQMKFRSLEELHVGIIGPDTTAPMNAPFQKSGPNKL